MTEGGGRDGPREQGGAGEARGQAEGEKGGAGGDGGTGRGRCGRRRRKEGGAGGGGGGGGPLQSPAEAYVWGKVLVWAPTSLRDELGAPQNSAARGGWRSPRGAADRPRD